MSVCIDLFDIAQPAGEQRLHGMYFSDVKAVLPQDGPRARGLREESLRAYGGRREIRYERKLQTRGSRVQC